MWRRRPTGNCPALNYYCFYEAKLCMRKLILLLFFSQFTPLHYAADNDHLEVARLLVESKADVAARGGRSRRCFSPPPSHHLSLTICLAAVVGLHSNWPSTTTEPTLLHTCAASARRNDAPPRPAPPPAAREPPPNKSSSSSSRRCSSATTARGRGGTSRCSRLTASLLLKVEFPGNGPAPRRFPAPSLRAFSSATLYRCGSLVLCDRGVALLVRIDA
jgi:hypothetical protein